MGPPVQVGQRTRSECRGVLNVVVLVSAIRARLATASIVGSAIGVRHSLKRIFKNEILQNLPENAKKFEENFLKD